MKFSGHDSFICKNLWLKKGYDFIQKDATGFSQELAVVDLGVGKNMVSAIQHWLKSFGIIDENGITKLGHYLFNENSGKDPYLESIGSVWLLHYSLIIRNVASIYNLFFNEFGLNRISFTKEQFSDFIIRKLKRLEIKNISVNTINADISVFIRNYLNPEFKQKKIDIEDEFSNLLIDLQLMETYQSENANEQIVEWYAVKKSFKGDLPWQIVLFSILNNESYSMSISFHELLNGVNSPGSIFALSDDGLFSKIELMVEHYKGQIIYSETAGIRELQFKSKPDKWKVLNEYYRH